MSSETKRIYKIRDNETGFFSLGGVNPKFGKIGKTWETRGALKSHLTLLREYASKQYASIYADRYVVVEYVLTLTETNVWPVLEESNRAPKK